MEYIISCGMQGIVRQYQIQFHNFVENSVDRRIQISRALSEHMFERGVILSYGKIGVKFEK